MSLPEFLFQTGHPRSSPCIGLCCMLKGDICGRAINIPRVGWGDEENSISQSRKLEHCLRCSDNTGEAAWVVALQVSQAAAQGSSVLFDCSHSLPHTIYPVSSAHYSSMMFHTAAM